MKHISLYYRLLTIILVFLFFASCETPINKNKTEEETNRITEYQIQVSNLFSPTLELTNHIKETSLRDLIKSNEGKLSASDKKMYDEFLLSESKRSSVVRNLYNRPYPGEYYTLGESLLFTIGPIVSPIEYSLGRGGIPHKASEGVILVPESSNLAKVYYLEDKVGFQVDNPTYVSIIIEGIKAEIKEKERQRQTEDIKKAQSNWAEYLK